MDVKGVRIVSLTGEKEYGIEDSEARQDVQQIVEGAPEAFDTLKEIAEYIAEDGATAAEIIKNVAANATAIADETTRAKTAEKELEVQIADEAARATAAEKANADAIVAERERADAKIAEEKELSEKHLADEIEKLKNGDTIVGQAREIHSEDGRSLVGETRNFLDRMYDNTAKTDAREVADYITNGIEDTKQNLALRALFINAGAEYNDTGADKTMTAPWGETVIHKAGHYYFNGLGDITEKQMMVIYNAPHNALYEQAYAEYVNIRTFLFRGGSSSVTINSCLNALFFNCSNLEVIGDNSGYLYFASGVPTVKNLFRRCKKLRVVAVRTYLNNATFDNSVFSECSSLEYIRLDRLHFSLSLADCSNITKDSVLYIIQKALPKNAITITLHPDAYARLADDADIVAALATQPLITLVSA